MYSKIFGMTDEEFLKRGSEDEYFFLKLNHFFVEHGKTRKYTFEEMFKELTELCESYSNFPKNIWFWGHPPIKILSFYKNIYQHYYLSERICRQ